MDDLVSDVPSRWPCGTHTRLVPVSHGVRFTTSAKELGVLIGVCLFVSSITQELFD